MGQVGWIGWDWPTEWEGSEDGRGLQRRQGKLDGWDEWSRPGERVWWGCQELEYQMEHDCELVL